MAERVRHAIILAGGKGERLRPHTNDKPKPMVELGEKPIFEYQLAQLTKAGIKEVIFACSYKKEILIDYVGDGSKYGIKVYYSQEDQPLGRGGAIKKALKQLPANWQDVVVTNGDNLWLLDLKSLISKHQNKDALATIVVVRLKSPYGIVEFDDKDQVKGFKEKPILPHWINAGVYVFSKEIEKLLPDVGDHEVETFPKLPKERFLVFKSDNYWRGIDTIKDLNEAEKEVLHYFKNL